ncbi:MAG: vitamin B12-dependent ribonucleotide reductase [Candidatus Fibromonas sp.]|jgi:ribonucleoside-diphosphate reductase alpha chain|nr:vitamin B12-dependent ribonucleotide reductase [Candidatus Fibromonas sp.]
MLSLNLTPNATKVLQSRYLHKNEKGECIEKPEDLYLRVAKSVASIEASYSENPKIVEEYTEKFYDLMASGRFLPNSPTLMNAGRNADGMLSACFVLPIEDSIDGIFSTVKSTAIIQKAGGGTGFSFDRLRPTGDYIKSSGGTTSGPISFWKVLSEATNAIQQGAFRRGANMGMMSVTHPDIITFIFAKQDLKAFTNFNISVKIPDSWMQAYKENPDGAHEVFNPRTKKGYVVPRQLIPGKYDIAKLFSLDDYNALPEKERPEVWTKRQVFRVIVDCAWRTGEPGLIFIDAINRANPTPNIGEIEATNPCGEQPLLPYEACNLGSINLSAFIYKDEGGKVEILRNALVETIHLATRFLDNIIDVNQYPIEEIGKMCKGNRKIGLGVMGFADALYKQGIPYNSEQGISVGERIMQVINEESHNASEILAIERGKFPNWEGSVWDTVQKRPMRNAATTTVAPTGTVSIIANCSGGIEPMFSLAFFRNVLEGQRLVEINPVFEEIAKEQNIYSDELVEKIAEKGTLADITEVPEEFRKIFVCSHDITPEWHVKMQAAFQKNCDSSISKTINLPHDATPEDVEKIYILAWESKCKGVTVYRDGCRENQPMALSKADSAPASENNAKKQRNPMDFQVRKPMKTPPMLPAIRMRQTTPFGHMHIAVTVEPIYGREMEIFAQLGKAGDVVSSDLEAISRMVSLYLRIGGSLEDIIEQLEGIGSHMVIPSKDGKVISLADALGKSLHRYHLAKLTYGLSDILTGRINFDELPALKDFEQEMAPMEESKTPPKPLIEAAASSANLYKAKCPECSGVLSFGEGCVKCPECGYSKC